MKKISAKLFFSMVKGSHLIKAENMSAGRVQCSYYVYSSKTMKIVSYFQGKNQQIEYYQLSDKDMSKENLL